MRDKDELDITDFFATQTIDVMIGFFQFLKENGYKKIYFDGTNASISVFRYENEKREKEKKRVEEASDEESFESYCKKMQSEI